MRTRAYLVRVYPGKTYEHRVPDDDAQAWLLALVSTVTSAKATASRRIFRQKYGHSAYSMMRARAYDLYHAGMPESKGLFSIYVVGLF